MDNRKLKIFFRNDDVRGELDDSLIGLTTVCVKNGIPISHAIEPANLSNEVASWLKTQKANHPGLIEIVQHGYDHNLKNPHQKMEFGGDRGYDDQLNDIRKGLEIMDSTFGEQWYRVFTFPYGTFNSETLKAVDSLGYKAISSKIKFSFKAQIKNSIGKLLGQDMLMGKKINYHPGVRKGYNFREISVSANLIRKYTGPSTADHYSLEEILGQIDLAAKHTDTIGVLFHHRFHGDHLGLTDKLIGSLKDRGCRFVTFKELTE